MRKNMIEDAIIETRQCLIHYWQNDSTYASKFFAEDVMWIGALKRQFIQGRDIVFSDLDDTNKTNPVCTLLQQEFWCISKDRNTCAIVGRYYVTVDSNQDEILSEQQRCTFIWECVKGELKIKHMHISSPVGYLEDEEVFSHKIGKSTYRYLCELVEEYSGRNNILKVKDINGHIRFINVGEIECAEANLRYTKISTITEEVVVKIAWNKILDEIDEKFVRVHRSYIVQRKYIKIIKPKEIILVSGKSIPLSRKYYKDLEQDT